MQLSKGVNSYSTVAEADDYFALRAHTGTWKATTHEDKQRGLVTATGILDGLSWLGCTVVLDQDLAHPRIVTFKDVFNGSWVTLDGSAVHKKIVIATFELAQHILDNTDLLEDTGSVGLIETSAAKLEGISSAALIPPRIRNIIKSLLVSSSANTWFRAN
jgi:hypothetical protein